jgi:histidinol-phosphate phosphatase family protein
VSVPEPANEEPANEEPSYAVVIPTLGRPSLRACLRALADGTGPAAGLIVLVDDRPSGSAGSAGDGPLEHSELEPGEPEPGDFIEAAIPAELADRTLVLRGGGRGPAAARNTGWWAVQKRGGAEWVAFLDDDTVPSATWAQDLAVDLAAAGPEVAGVQGRITVPLPADRRPTDWERGTAALADSRWITADLAYRLAALRDVAGFDERFRRAYREDADIALRMLDAGWRLEHGRRETVHPVRPGRFWASVRSQAGNADDVLMRRLHGPGWRADCGAPRGRLRRHLVITGAATAALVSTVTGHKRPAALAAAVWLAGTAEFAWTRIRLGPRTPGELATMAVTSPVIPPAATRHWIRGLVVHRHAQPWPVKSSGQENNYKKRFKSMLPVTRLAMNRMESGPGGPWVRRRDGVSVAQPDSAPERDGMPAAFPTAVLFDRDGTLVDDVPYNGDPDAVRLRPGAVEAVQALRARGVAVGVVTNQSGVARGRLTRDQVEAVHRRIEELLGPLDVWAVCPHGPQDGCGCRKPAPGLVLAAAEALGVPVCSVVVIGDIGADIEAAEAAGATGILVPTPVTRPEETAAAARTAATLLEATLSVLPSELAARAHGDLR